ncbi:hypothetical protein MHTCC0001_21100 [Flavobacteriaceae bacterium MHTCC 0001]
MFSCNPSQNIITPKDLSTFNGFVDAKAFTITSDWAYPQATNAVVQVLNSQLLAPGSNANAVNLIGNPNFLTIKGDSVSSYLPYFGERQMRVAYGGGDSAIQFNGFVENFITTHGKNNRKILSFQATSNGELFDVTITLFPNLNSQILLRSPYRFFIRYTGKAKPIHSNKIEP